MRSKLWQAWLLLPRGIRRWLTALIGASVLAVGIVMIVAPGPAIVVIPLGLSILAAEFAWARHLIRRIVPEQWQPQSLRNPSEQASDPGLSSGSTSRLSQKP